MHGGLRKQWSRHVFEEQFEDTRDLRTGFHPRSVTPKNLNRQFEEDLGRKIAASRRTSFFAL